MIKVTNKFLGALLVGVLSFTYITGLATSQDIRTVYATTYPDESKALRNAQAKINHLTKSLKTNYLGIKNQATWQLYISQARELIKKIPNHELSKRSLLEAEVNKDEALVNALARINQVEKSIQPKSEGGYGNYLGIKNAEIWNGYLNLAKTDLEKVDKGIFKKQYDELIVRMNKVSLVVKDIEDKFIIEYDKVVKLYEEAKSSNSLDKAKAALVEAEKLGTCDRSDKLENNIIQLINNHPDNENKIVHFPDKELEDLVRNEIGKPLGNIYKSDVEKITELAAYSSMINNISGIENLINLQSFYSGGSRISDISPLKNLTKLQYLGLPANPISDISPLENLINLEQLDLGFSVIRDISPLKNLTKLEFIFLEHNDIRDIDSLENLTKLKVLTLGQNDIKDISSLRNLTDLHTLSLYNNRINNISSLKNLIELRYLYLEYNDINNVSPLENLTKLEELFLKYNNISDIMPLKNLINLKYLNAEGTQLSENDIKKLKNHLPNCIVTLYYNEPL